MKMQLLKYLIINILTIKKSYLNARERYNINLKMLLMSLFNQR